MKSSAAKRLEKVVKRMRKVQKAIAADDQPVSPLQLQELTRLGREYAEIIDSLGAEERSVIS